MGLAETAAPITQGVVRRIRQHPDTAVSRPRGGIHEVFAPANQPYPLITWTLVADPVVKDHGTEDDEGTREIRALVDIEVWSRSSVEAKTLDGLLATWFNERAAPDLDALVDEQHVYHLERIGRSGGSGPATDDEGRKYYREGGAYSIWTTSPIAKPS